MKKMGRKNSKDQLARMAGIMVNRPTKRKIISGKEEANGPRKPKK